MTGWHRPDVVTSTQDHLAQIVGPVSAQQMVDGLIDLGRKQRDGEVEKLRERIAELEAELAKYVGHEPTLAEEALYKRGQQVVDTITGRLANRATLYGDSGTVNEVIRDLVHLAEGGAL